MSCKTHGVCDFCDARCASYIFDFTEEALGDGKLFEKEFLSWYDCGKPDSNFEEISDYETPARFLLSEYDSVDTIRGEDRRWSVWIDKVYKIGDRYFMTGYDHGLTEMQENNYWYTDIKEVKPTTKIEVVRSWKTI